MRKKGLLFILLGFIFLQACQPKSEYQKLVDIELSKGIVYDSLFAGLSFAMTQKEFFDHCWEMNGKGVFTNGVGSQVLYDASEDFSRPTNLGFYPKYINGQMIEMPMEFRYQDWALWNEETKVELLIEELKIVLMDWYGGNDFIEVESADGSVSIWVKIDGNRQIRLGRKNISTALVTITDLARKKEIESNQKS